MRESKRGVVELVVGTVCEELAVEQEKRLGVMEEKLSGMEGMIKALYEELKGRKKV